MIQKLKFGIQIEKSIGHVLSKIQGSNFFSFSSIDLLINPTIKKVAIFKPF